MMLLLPREKLQMVVVEGGACALAAALLPGRAVTERWRWLLTESWGHESRWKLDSRMKGLELLEPSELLE